MTTRLCSSSDLWVNKWRPATVNDVIGNKLAVQKIEDWISKFDQHTNNSIIISGCHGIGKTMITQMLLEKYNYKTKLIYPDEIKQFRTEENFDDYFNFDNSIIAKVKMRSKESKKIALVFDETESITLTSERKYVFNIYKINAKIKSFPLVFISNTNHSKLVNDLKKYCTEIKFYSPSSYDLSNYIKKICKEEHIDIKDNDSIEQLIKFSQYDIRRLVNVLQEYHYNFNTLNKDDMTIFIERSIMKDTNIGLYEASMMLLNSFDDFQQMYKLYETDKVLIPLMISENYYKKILSVKNSSSWEDQLKQMVEVSDSMSIGDNIETSIYTDQNWYLQDIHGFYTCFNTSYHINKSSKQLFLTDMKFTADLNKTSLKNINRKNIGNLEKILVNKSLNEILMLCRITNHLISCKESGKLISILKHYKKDIDIKDIELCLKIDKTVDFMTLSTKDKKEINSIMV